MTAPTSLEDQAAEKAAAVAAIADLILTDLPLDQAELAARWGRSDRTIRNWVAEARAIAGRVSTEPEPEPDPSPEAIDFGMWSAELQAAYAAEEPVIVQPEVIQLPPEIVEVPGPAVEVPGPVIVKPLESILQVRKPAKGFHGIAVAVVVIVATVALGVSYAHMQNLAETIGQGGASWFLPLSIDGKVIMASLVMLARKRQGQPAGFAPWFSLVLGIAASVAANIYAPFASDSDMAAVVIVNAWPPIAGALAFHLLLLLRKRSN